MQIFMLGFDGAYAGLLTSLMEIFQKANRLAVTASGASGAEALRPQLASPDGRPIRCRSGIDLNVSCAVADIPKADLIVVTSIHDVDRTLDQHPDMVDWLRQQHRRGVRLASICTGAFLLAETGLLDGKAATTHWSMLDRFRKRYPLVQLEAENVVVNDGILICAGGHRAGIDLAYFLVQKHLGHGVAVQTAKFFVHDFKRASQTTYAVYTPKTDHNDLQILKTQRFIGRHLESPLHLADMVAVACLSRRTFERRFKQATGDSPLVYLQRLRVEAAKQLLETTNDSFDEIAYRLTYRNSGSFRKIFVRWAELLPSEYRRRFAAYESP